MKEVSRMDKQNMITLDNVSKKYGKKVILKKVSFNIPSGKIVGLVGPNGAGKSTLMKMILGIIKSDSGKIRFNTGVNAKNIGSLIEYPNVYPFLTGKQHLELYSSNKKQIQRVITELNMESYITNSVKSYSVGMRQKLGLAMALVNNSQMVILDEPLNGLDPIATVELRDLIIKQNERGVTFLISSHILSELEKIIDNVVLISSGRVLIDKPISNLKQQSIQKYRLIINNTGDIQPELLHLEGVAINFKEKYVELKMENKLKLNQVIGILVKEGIEVLEIQPVERDLEDMIIDTLQRG